MLIVTNEKISKNDFAEALSQLLAKKPDLIEAVQETMEDIWAQNSALKAKKSGSADKESVLKDLYGN